MQPGDTVHSSDDPKTPAPDEGAESFYHAGSEQADTPLQATTAEHKTTNDKDELSWEASEYADNEKAAGWYVVLAVAAVAVGVITYLLTNGDLVTTFAIAIAAVLFGIVAARKPRTLRYVIDGHGVTIGEKSYPYAMFKTFSVNTETTLHSVQLLPLKRFMQPISIYFPPNKEEAVVNILGQYLPYEERGHDAFDRLMNRIGF